MTDPKVARRTLDTAVAEFMASDSFDPDRPNVMTNWVLIFAGELIDDDGDEATGIGWTSNPGAPTYITLGLVEAARRHLRKNT